MSESAITSTLAQLASQSATSGPSAANNPQDVAAFNTALNTSATPSASGNTISNGPASIQNLQALTAAIKTQQASSVALAQTQQAAGAYGGASYRPKQKVSKTKTPFRQAVQEKSNLDAASKVPSLHSLEMIPDAIKPAYKEYQESVFETLIAAGVQTSEKRKRVMAGIDKILADNMGKEMSTSTMLRIQMDVQELGITFDLASALAKKMTTFLETLFRA